MSERICKGGLALVVVLMLSACGSKDRPLLLAGQRVDSPDEFLVLPSKPLQAPKSYSELPTPTPGAENLTDPTPHADATVALGGRASAVSGGGPADGAIVNFASRYGVQADIRQVLSAEDDQRRRKRGGVLTRFRLVGNRYFLIYTEDILDQHEELRRLRALGIVTPTAPPK